MDKEPILGANAKPFLIQMAAGLVVATLAKWIGIGDLAFWLSCTYLTGTCS